LYILRNFRKMTLLMTCDIIKYHKLPQILIYRWYHKNLEFSENRNLFDNYISDMFTVSENMRTPDTWFL
jgi:hypothetical protein